MTGSGDPALLVEGLVKRYAGRPVVDGLSFGAPRAAVTAVLGPNGAGKTTAIECCEGLRRADSGRISVLGLHPVRDAGALHPRVGVMLQDGGLPMGARAGELVEHLARLHARPLPVAPLLLALGLAGHRHSTVRRLSGGQRQRLALACAVIGRPELVFLDEPTAGLDPQSRLAVWELVGRLRAGGAGVLLTTHLMDDAERLADRVVVVDGGRVVAAGSPADLLGGGQELRFRAEPDLPPGALGSLAELLPRGAVVTRELPGRYRVRAADGEALGPRTVATVTAWCADLEVVPVEVSLGRRSLEEVFLELTGRSLR
jgi:ABC-2 type transport system ATP-binding protein